jgi:ribosomal protein S27E
VQTVHLSGAQGELPKMPPLNAEFTVVELRNEAGRVVSLDYGVGSGENPRVYSGIGVQLSALQMQGLREESSKEDKTAAQFSCPNCGAPITLKLENSKAITCGSCNAVIDTSKGTAAALVSALQDEPIKPSIPLGSTGNLQGFAWQVVGFQHRLGSEPDDDESFGWEEYLLYNRIEGFCFLVDASDGWSLVRPTTGAPKYKPGASQASYLGRDYTLKYSYKAETTYVAGEFYWQVNRGAVTQNTDFEAGTQKLAREQSGDEVTWSRGEAIAAAKVAQAFKLELPPDASPLGGSGLSIKTIVILIIVALIVLALFSRCSTSCDPQRENCSNNSTYRSGTSGGSYGGGLGGGGTGGGGHK